MEDIGVLQLKTALKKAAYDADARTTSKSIFDSMTGNHEAGGRLAYSQVEKSMYVARRRKVPRFPTSMEDAAQLLEGKIDYLFIKIII
jgi:hypothetical protein